MPSSPGPSSLSAPEVFASVRYTIASSFPSHRADQLRHVLDINGAVYLENGLSDPTLDTIITNSNRFEGWEDVTAREGVRAVSDKWVERSVILGKMQPPQYYSPDPAMIFSGIVGCASDLPSTDLEVLSAGITALGGQWRMGLTKDVTHLFALNPDSRKYATAMHFSEETGIKVVLPHWFDDAVRLGMGNLPTKPYEWPDPELLKNADVLMSEKDVKAKGKAALAELEQNDVKRNMYATAVMFTPALGRSSPPTESEISLILGKVPGSSNEPSGSNLTKAQVWKGRKILLSRSLELYKGRREAVQAGIERAGGIVLRFEGDGDESEPSSGQQKPVRDKLSKKERIRRRNEALRVADSDVFVTRWRHGRAYVRACQEGKSVGTLAWLFHVQSSGVLSNPQDQLLHYPVPKRNIEGFSNHVITVTNYTGEAREYIKKLIAAMGATFTPSMSGDNTVLIAAYLGGTKADKAHSWSIPIVNHTWIEDCFVQWRNLTMALEKYIIFPSGVDFSSLLGERGVGVGSHVMKEVEELTTNVFEEDEDYLSDEPGLDDDRVEADLDMPNGTAGSAKEVAKGLVDGSEADAVVVSASRSRSKPQSEKSTGKSHNGRVPDGMDLDFEPPSTAAVVVNHFDWNIGVDFHDDCVGSKDDEKDEEPVKLKKFSKISSTKGSRISRKTRQRSQSEDDEDKDIVTLQTTTARRETVDVFIPKKSVKDKPKAGKRTEDIIELDSDDELPKKKKAEEKESKRISPSAKARTRTEKMKEPSSEEDERPARKHRKVPVASAKKSDSETEDDSEPAMVKKPKTPLRRIVEVVMTTPPNKGKGKEVRRDDDDDDEVILESKKGKSTLVSVTPKTAGTRLDGLLKKAKADARTRIKRKSVPKGNVFVESEEEEEEQPKNLQTGSKGRGPRNGLEKPGPSKTKLKTQPTISTKAPVRSKPLRVYSSEGIESEDEEIPSEVAEGTASDEDLPETVHHPSGSRAKTRETTRASAKTATSKLGNPVVASKRTISLISPSSMLSKGKRADEADKMEVVHPPEKSKKKRIINESASEDEVDELISARTRSGLTKSNSFKTVVGQSSKDVIASGRKSREQETRSHHALKTTRVERAEEDSMEVDDGHNSRSSPASTSVPSMAAPRRNAAAKASRRLHDTLMPDLVNFETQMKKAKGKSTGGLSAFALDFEEDRGQDVGKRKKIVHIEEEGDGSDEEAQPKKRRRVSDEHQQTSKAKGKGKQKAKEDAEASNPSGVVLLTTQITLGDDVLKALGKLGVRMTTRPSECTHLLCPHLVRTEKFLCALAHAPFILSVKWATASAAAKKLLPEKEFILKDATGEKKFELNLVQTLRRAKANKGKLLEGKMFYLTPRVSVDKKLLKNVVNACGGDVTTQSPSLRIIRVAPENRYVISCRDDISIWRPIAAEGYKIYSQELLLAGIMKQEIEWDREEFMVEA